MHEVSSKVDAIADLQTRMQRMERDMRDVELELYRRNNSDKNPQELGIVTTDQMGPISQRVTDMQEAMQQMTGQMEVLSHNVEQLTQRLDRMQKDVEFRFNSLKSEEGSPAPVASGGPALAPASGSLGTIPAGSRVADLGSPPTPVANPQKEYDAAMNLLARAQYDAAEDAFRGFANAHPDDELAPQALYWTGDIAFSSKRDYADAARFFAEMLKRYGKSTRAPDAMVKLGVSLINIGQKKDGCTTLAALDAKYPNASGAVSTRAHNERKNAKCG